MASIEREFRQHLLDDQKNFDKIHEALEEIQKTLNWQNKTLAPIADTYSTATTLGKWITSAVVFLSLIIGTIVTLVKYWKSK